MIALVPISNGGASFPDVKRLRHQGFVHDAARSLDYLADSGASIPVSTFYCLLKSCTDSRNIRVGRHVYCSILRNGLEADAFLGCHLVRLFSSCGSLSEASYVFQRMPKSSVFAWTAIISAHCSCGHPENAFKLYLQMQELDVKLNDYTFNVLLQVCSSTSALIEGNVLYSHILESDLGDDVFVGSTLIDMYVKCGCLTEARSVFDRLPRKSIVAWSTVITGYGCIGESEAAIDVFRLMQQNCLEPNLVTFLGLLKACTGMVFLDYGKQIHAFAISSCLESESAIGNSLIDMYTRCGSLEDAESVFHGLPKKTLVTWSMMLSAYARFGQGWTALSIFQQMLHEGVDPDPAMFSGLFNSCCRWDMLHRAKQIHVIILHGNVQVGDLLGSIIINMYFKCSSVADASKVFERLAKESTAPWNAFIGGLSDIGLPEKAIYYFQYMQLEHGEPDDVTYVSAVKACYNIADLQLGELLYAYTIASGYDSNMIIGNALVCMYTKYGSLDDALCLFENLPKRDIVSWSTIISGYAEHGHGQKALHLFGKLQLELQEQPDNVLFLSVLKACSLISALNQGILVHSQAIECGWESDILIGNCLIDMYAKCGNLHDAFTMFKRIAMKTVTSWNSMITGFSNHNSYELALNLFNDMLKEGLKPDDTTFVSLLSACNHLGLVSEGCSHFKSLWNYNIVPSLEHYTCLIELLGHVGLLRDAASLAMTCPFKPNFVTMTSLLNHSKAYGALVLGKESFNLIIQIDSSCPSGHGIMVDSCTIDIVQEDAAEEQLCRVDAKSWKKPGQAFIEMKQRVLDFTEHEQIQQRSCSFLEKLQMSLFT